MKITKTTLTFSVGLFVYFVFYSNWKCCDVKIVPIQFNINKALCDRIPGRRCIRYIECICIGDLHAR